MDVLRLIEEVKKRPILWDHKPDYKERPNLTAVWQQVADAVGSDVKTCKGKWRNLRDAFRAEVRRTQRRAEKYKSLSKNDPRAKGTSKWAYFVPMSFIVKSQQRPTAFGAVTAPSPTLSHINEMNVNDADDENTQHSIEGSVITMKSAPAGRATAASAFFHSSEESNDVSVGSDNEMREEEVHVLGTDSEIGDDDNDNDNVNEDADVDIDEEMFRHGEEDQDMLFNEFQNLATPQAMRRLSHCISVANAEADEQQDKDDEEEEEQEQQQQQQQEQQQRKQSLSPTDGGDGGNTNSNGSSLPTHPNAHMTPTKPNNMNNSSGSNNNANTNNSNNNNCKCSTRADEQVHFLENLEREEEKLIQSTRQDITRCKEMLHVGDSDYNFLISFLPLMKKMSDLQNIHFRAKMSELLVHTMGMATTQPVASSASQASTSLSQMLAAPLAGFNPATSICATTQSQPHLFILQTQAPTNVLATPGPEPTPVSMPPLLPIPAPAPPAPAAAAAATETATTQQASGSVQAVSNAQVTTSSTFWN